ncbi:MAG: YfgM family protein [Cardiobacterium sp.]
MIPSTDRTDEETVELIREWLQQYGLTIIIGLVIGLGAIGGYRYWQNSQETQSANESTQLDTLLQALEKNDLKAAVAPYDSLLKAGGDISALASLNMAAAYQKAGQKEEALTALKLAAASPDKLVAQSALWQQAQYQIDNNEYDAALQTVDGLKDSAYAAQAAALQGIILEKQNKLPEALQALQRSQELAPSTTTAAEINALQARLAVQEP